MIVSKVSKTGISKHSQMIVSLFPNVTAYPPTLFPYPSDFPKIGCVPPPDVPLADLKIAPVPPPTYPPTAIFSTPSQSQNRFSTPILVPLNLAVFSTPSLRPNPSQYPYSSTPSLLRNRLSTPILVPLALKSVLVPLFQYPKSPKST